MDPPGEPFVGLRRGGVGGVATLTLARPERRNALSLALIESLQVALREIAEDPNTSVVVLGAEGEVFCSGHDLAEMAGRTEEIYRHLFEACTRMMLAIRSLPQPVIARVQGMATAAGCQLVASCDLAVAADSAQFATPGVKIGLFCSTPMVPLVRAIPPRAALEMLLTGNPISASRALELGLLNRVVPVDQLDAAVAELVDAIRSASPTVIRLGKRAFREGLGLGEPDAYNRAVDVMTENALLADAQEGIAAFLQKRRPRWTGR